MHARPVRRDLWSARFRLQGMKNPGPRMRTLDGFNEGWIEFQDRGCKAIKGQTSAAAVIAALVAEMHPLCATHAMQPDIPVHTTRTSKSAAVPASAHKSSQMTSKDAKMRKLSVAVIGAGMGGLAAAAALRRVGIDVTVYEQAQRFARLGAGIQIGCNAMKVLRAFGLEPLLRAGSFYPRSWNNKDYDTGAVRFDMIFGEAAEARYGAPYLLAHRGDLHAALASVVPESDLRLDHRLTSFEQRGDGSIRLRFANGATADADALVAADGVHSLVKDVLFGKEEPNFTGRVAYRTVFPAALLNGYPIDDCTKWWGHRPHRQSTMSNLTAAKSISSPASRNPASLSNLGRPWATWRSSAKLSPDSIRRFSTC